MSYSSCCRDVTLKQLLARGQLPVEILTLSRPTQPSNSDTELDGKKHEWVLNAVKERDRQTKPTRARGGGSAAAGELAAQQVALLNRRKSRTIPKLPPASKQVLPVAGMILPYLWKNLPFPVTVTHDRTRPHVLDRSGGGRVTQAARIGDGVEMIGPWSSAYRRRVARAWKRGASGVQETDLASRTRVTVSQVGQRACAVKNRNRNTRRKPAESNNKHSRLRVVFARSVRDKHRAVQSLPFGLTEKRCGGATDSIPPASKTASVRCICSWNITSTLLGFELCTLCLFFDLCL